MSKMMNFEKYKDEILKIVNTGDNIAKKDGKITGCKKIPCPLCEFSFERNGEICSINTIKWLFAEATPTLTKRERGFCEMVGEGYIARDEDGILFHSQINKPHRETGIWGLGSGNYVVLRNSDFKFIAWDDEEPWAVEDLLKMEVEE